MQCAYISSSIHYNLILTKTLELVIPAKTVPIGCVYWKYFVFPEGTIKWARRR